MRLFLSSLMLTGSSLSGCLGNSPGAESPPPSSFAITAIPGVTAPGATLERVATGLRFVEGPAWEARSAAWLFSDIPANCIYRLDAQLALTIVEEPSRNTNGNFIDRAGNRYSCEHGSRQVTRTAVTDDGSIRTVIASTYHGKSLNSPNDCVLATDGALWFTDPDYGLAGRASEQPCHGVYRLAAGAAEPELMLNDCAQPNGLCFSPDGKTLYLADSGKPHHVRAFTLRAGSYQPTAGRVFAVISPGVPDGLRCDSLGRLFVTAGDGVQVFAADGQHLGTIAVPESPANCAFGGPQGTTLLITARTSCYRIALMTGQ